MGILPSGQHTRRNGVVDEVLKGKNRNKSRIRERVEHDFGLLNACGVWQDTFPRTAKERHKGIHRIGAGQYPPQPSKFDGGGGSLRAQSGPIDPYDSLSGASRQSELRHFFAILPVNA